MITSKNYKQLLIQISLTQFTFFVKNKLSNEIEYLKKFELTHLEAIELQLEEVFIRTPQLRTQYDEIYVYHNNRLNTFVPEVLFDENAMGLYLQYTTKVFATDFFAYDTIVSRGLNNVYIPYMNINNFLIDKFGSFNYHHSSTPFMELALNLNKSQNTKQVFLHFQKDYFEIVVAEHAKLILFNSFQYQTPEDFIYYLLFVYEQLQLQVEEHPVTLMGLIDTESELYKIAYKFIRHLNILPSKAFISNSIKAEHPIEEHFILLNL